MKALDVAKYFLFLARNREAGDTISNLKIQKCFIMHKDILLPYLISHFLTIG
ncbi:TPA: hypothetical protein R0M07_000168 [Campylobacter jejuni]|nr:hypothetical protein [Campylobacter jejuni]